MIKKGDKGKGVKLIQELLWLHPHGVRLDIDGDFGPATEAAVKVFQSNANIDPSGEVDGATTKALHEPLVSAQAHVSPASTLGATIVKVARKHLKSLPHETPPFRNTGPWVRLYMGGNEGKAWLWCAGFVSYILRQASDAHHIPMPYKRTFSCDNILKEAVQKGKLLEHGKGDPKPGDVFLIVKSANRNDAVHTGIVISVHKNSIRTIEGNTNDGGSRNGVEVASRFRSRKDTIVYAQV